MRAKVKLKRGELHGNECLSTSLYQDVAVLPSSSEVQKLYFLATLLSFKPRTAPFRHSPPMATLCLRQL